MTGREVWWCARHVMHGWRMVRLHGKVLLMMVMLLLLLLMLLEFSGKRKENKFQWNFRVIIISLSIFWPFRRRVLRAWPARWCVSSGERKTVIVLARVHRATPNFHNNEKTGLSHDFMLFFTRFVRYASEPIAAWLFGGAFHYANGLGGDFTRRINFTPLSSMKRNVMTDDGAV